MPLKTTTTLPPGGWVYEQKDNAGKVVQKFKSMSPFNEAAMQVLKLRENNKYDRATLAEVKEDLDNAQCERLGFDARFCSSKKKPFNINPISLFKVSAQHLRESAEAVAARVEQAADGLQIIRDWLGDGAKPVEQSLSQARADICTGRLSGNPCPLNKDGFKPVEAAAATIKAQLEEKRKMALTVEGEANLKTCDVCWCHLPLKVHVPLATILKRTPKPLLEKFQQAQPACWMLTEQQNPA